MPTIRRYGTQHRSTRCWLYKGGAKQAWDNTDLTGPWLNGMRNSLNSQIWGFKEPNFLCVSATHGPAHLALYDQDTWGKYQLAKLAGGNFTRNTFIIAPPASVRDPADFQAIEGAFSSKDNSVVVLQRRGVVDRGAAAELEAGIDDVDAGGADPDRGLRRLDEPGLVLEGSCQGIAPVARGLGPMQRLGCLEVGFDAAELALEHFGVAHRHGREHLLPAGAGKRQKLVQRPAGHADGNALCITGRTSRTVW